MKCLESGSGDNLHPITLEAKSRSFLHFEWTEFVFVKKYRNGDNLGLGMFSCKEGQTKNNSTFPHSIDGEAKSRLLLCCDLAIYVLILYYDTKKKYL